MPVAALLRTTVPAALVAALVASAPAAADDLDAYRAKFDAGPLLPDAGTRWVPQGLAYLKQRDALVVSYYDGAKDEDGNDLAGPLDSQVALMHRTRGTLVGKVRLAERGHVGGIAFTKKYLWVANSDAGDGYNVHAYDVKKLLRAPVTPGVGPKITWSRRFKVEGGGFKASYLTITGSKLFVGDFGANRAYRYTILGRGNRLTKDPVTIVTPEDTQGMAVKGGKAVFSTSNGRDNRSALIVRPVGATSGGARLVAPNMSEGVAFARGELHVVYESSSDLYDDSDLKTRTIDHAPNAALGF